MTVSELIEALLKMPKDAKVAVYESDPDDWLEIGKLEIANNGSQVNLYSQWAAELYD